MYWSFHFIHSTISILKHIESGFIEKHVFRFVWSLNMTPLRMFPQVINTYFFSFWVNSVHFHCYTRISKNYREKSYDKKKRYANTFTRQKVNTFYVIHCKPTKVIDTLLYKSIVKPKKNPCTLERTIVIVISCMRWNVIVGKGAALNNFTIDRQ